MNRASTILVVDDNPMNLELVTDILEGAGYVVHQALTAEDALERVSTLYPDLILMDIGLPGMDGYAAVARLKADRVTAEIPTVALSAAAMTGDDARALESGFDGYITKPINTKTFPALISSLLAQHRRTT